MDCRALVVDDEAMIREIFRIYLEQWGFEVLTASSHSAGMAVASTQKFDLVFSDYQLLDGPGLEVLSAARDLNQQAVLFTLSEHWSEPERSKVKDFGCFAFYKPCDWDQLHERITSSLDSNAPGRLEGARSSKRAAIKMKAG